MTLREKKYDALISDHARERWVERILNAARYVHMKTCTYKDCCECMRHHREIQGIVAAAGRGIDGQIIKCFRESTVRVQDPNFFRAVRKQWSEEELKCMEFLKNNKTILVVGRNPGDEYPVIRTVLTEDMLEGQIFNKIQGQELKTVFGNWKLEAKRRNVGKVPKL